MTGSINGLCKGSRAEYRELQYNLPVEALSGRSYFEKLYRVMAVKRDVLKKCLLEDRGIALRNRKYTSWSDREEGVEIFFRNSVWDFNDHVPVMFRKVFHTGQVVLHILPALEALKKDAVLNNYNKGLVDWMIDGVKYLREVVVKHSAIKAVFSREDLYKYFDSKTRTWKPIKDYKEQDRD